MRLENHRLLDALCGEYIIGTLRGGARRRFERAMRSEPRAALRLRYWESIVSPKYSKLIEAQPSPRVWQRLQHELDLARYRMPWHRRAAFWQGWAVAATAALVFTLAMLFLPRPSETLQTVQIARLSGTDGAISVTADLSRDGRTLVLHASRPVLAGPKQSFELWLIPVAGTGPVPVAVLGSLDATFALATAQLGQLRPGSTLAVSAEPAGGSPTGKPTGAVILAGKITG